MTMLCIGEKIDKLIPKDLTKRNVSVGQAAWAMVLNGLGFANSPLYLTQCVDGHAQPPAMASH